jgi:hypothetical protein
MAVGSLVRFPQPVTLILRRDTFLIPKKQIHAGTIIPASLLSWWNLIGNRALKAELAPNQHDSFGKIKLQGRSLAGSKTYGQGFAVIRIKIHCHFLTQERSGLPSIVSVDSNSESLVVETQDGHSLQINAFKFAQKFLRMANLNCAE